jgi:ankyrin repeat protein
VGNLDIAQLLISYGANASVTDKWWHSPLYHTLQRQKPDVLELLVKGGADVGARGRGQYVFHLAWFLVEHGADIDAPRRQKCQIPFSIALANGH